MKYSMDRGRNQNALKWKKVFYHLGTFNKDFLAYLRVFGHIETFTNLYGGQRKYKNRSTVYLVLVGSELETLQCRN